MFLRYDLSYIVLHDEIDYSYTHYIHEARRLFPSLGIDLVPF